MDARGKKATASSRLYLCGEDLPTLELGRHLLELERIPENVVDRNYIRVACPRLEKNMGLKKE